jgi:SNF2-related domain/Helicase conserved C-terminal domain
MTLLLKQFGNDVRLIAREEGLSVESTSQINWARTETWPLDSQSNSAGRRTAFEVASLLEMGLGDVKDRVVVIPYRNFPDIEAEDFRITTAFAVASPFLLKIDRSSDLGRPDFRYQYQYMLGTERVPLVRVGFYARRTATSEVFRLDERMFALLEAMDAFNALPPGEKGPQRAWLDFAHIKRWATDVDAMLDGTLLKNDVIVPSSIGLDLYEDEKGALSFIPTCPELDNDNFRTVFERNDSVEGFYSLDRPGLGRLRIVLTSKQRTVLERMKRVRRVSDERKESLKSDPRPIFDGVTGDVELPYGDRVIGIGQYEFVPVPKAHSDEGPMSGLWGDATPSGPAEPRPVNDHDKTCDGSTKRTLLIDTHDEFVRQGYLEESELARQSAPAKPYERPNSLRAGLQLKRHQEQGVHWLQTCAGIDDRRGVLLADDMGVGKTLQILSFLAWAIESGQFPDLARSKPPFRPILIIAPLILLETETWENEMKKFFADNGEVFGNVLPLYGPELLGYRRKDAEGREEIVAKPILNLERIQRNHVVITNYEAVRDYEFSFAYCPNGRSLWSIVVTDEAHEYKTPNSKISHAIKALKPDFRIACTGTPVENRLLDMWNLFDAVQPGLLGSAREFAAQYESRLENDARERSLAGLKSRLLYQKPHAFLLRRSKNEVLELPRKYEHKIVCTMSSEEIAQHQNLVSGLGGAKQTKGKLDLLHKFARMYQHLCLLEGDGDDFPVSDLKANSSKLREVLSVLHKIRGLGEKAIIFARHKDMQRMLARVLSDEFGKPVRVINGDTPRASTLRKAGVETRSSILSEFRQAIGFDVVVLSPFVAGVGLTIVEANHVVHYGRWWNPAVEAQATDRVYRLGQTREVHVYLPILEDRTGQVSPTFDQLLDSLMESKKGLAEGALQKDDFLTPQVGEDEVGLQVFSGLEHSVQSEKSGPSWG